ncbi:MAG: terminase small subunit [Cetobacterium sp.]
MAKVKDPNRELAFKLWRENKGITNREIAKTLEVDEKKIATWKVRDKWNEKLGISKVSVKKKARSTTKKGDNVVKKTNVVQQIEEKSEKNKNKIITDISKKVFGDDGLTEKQRKFCVYYIQSFNATQSAIKAGYSKDTSYQIGFENLKKVEIKKYLTELKENSEYDDFMTTKMLLERHKKIAFSDYKEFVNSDGEVADLSDVDGTLIKKITIKRSVSDTGNSYSSTLELEDRSKSLDFLNKFYGVDPVIQLAKERIEMERAKNNPTSQKEEEVMGLLKQLEEALNG